VASLQRFHSILKKWIAKVHTEQCQQHCMRAVLSPRMLCGGSYFKKDQRQLCGLAFAQRTVGFSRAPHARCVNPVFGGGVCNTF